VTRLILECEELKDRLRQREVSERSKADDEVLLSERKAHIEKIESMKQVT
jgi:hypothetical protein